MTLKIENLRKRFGRFQALNDLSLDIAAGEFLVLLGPSGSGKTTLLRVLAGLDRPDLGGVTLDGEDFLALSARERRVGLVFQHYALFQHMTVARNIAFGLSVRPARQRPSGEAIGARVKELVALTQIEGLGDRYPAQLSGGQRQRVAVARALAVEPRVLLLDEPFGALDTKVRAELRGELRRIHDATGVTSILVTHDRQEAMALADRVAVMNAGRIEQVGSSQQLEAQPISPFVFEFLGETNRLGCEVADGVARFEGFMAPVGGSPADGAGMALFRPYETILTPDSGGEGLSVLIIGMARRGAVGAVECQSSSGQRFSAEMPLELAAQLKVGGQARMRATRVVIDVARREVDDEATA